VDELLAGTRSGPEEAAVRCGRLLAARWRGFGLARRCLPPEVREDVVALLAWHALVRETLGSARDAEEEKRWLAVLREVLEEVRSGDGDRVIALALRRAVQRHGLSQLAFAGPLDELARSALVHTHETRTALQRHARRLVQGETRMLLSILGLEGERSELLADALALGMQLADWLVHVERDIEKGHVHFAVEDLARHRVDLLGLRSGRCDEGMRLVVRDQVAWSRELLSRGWPLTLELDAWRGRQLAYVLRWHAASLSAVEARGYDVLSGPPPAGWLRILACTVASAIGRGSPWQG
jgi:phytoene/squalene synthetase